ncbi:Ig-like domain-containing protein [Luteimonas aquatica]|uniref:Ig-like domain-containing protein n=1 Tax=Luteimonas aquatica TaxID=450364 RepID=UPI001F593F0C|nr:Ig-like domain-containing protein [Luteimonas aquatica]
MCCGPVLALVTGVWTVTSDTSATTTTSGIAVTVSGSTGNAAADYTGGATSRFNTTNYWTEPYGGTIAGANSLQVNLPFGFVPGRTITVNFNKPVDNPVMHFDRLGGGSGTGQTAYANSSRWTLSGSNSSGGSVSLTRLGGNAQFLVNGNAIQRDVGANNVRIDAAQLECNAVANGATAGTACGSVRFNGTGISSLTFTVDPVGYLAVGPGATGIGDGLEIGFSFLGSSVVVRKQSIGGTALFPFTLGNLTGANPSLNTANGNPASSASFPVTDHSQAIVITEGQVDNYEVTSATCEDATGNGVPSTLDSNTQRLTIASADYGTNQAITCTFVNTGQANLHLRKQLPDGRYVPADQFALTITGPGGSSVTTTGSGSTADGVVTVSPAPAGTSFTFSETGANGADLAHYDTTYSCSVSSGSSGAGNGDGGGGAGSGRIAGGGNRGAAPTVIGDTSGNGTSFSLIPEAGETIDCTFINQRHVEIDAVDDDYSGTPVNGANGGNLPTVLGNDTLNGQPVDPAEIALTPGTAPTPAQGSITMNPDGTITVAPGTTAGTYTYPYTICDDNNASNCDTATATIVVEAPPIDAVDDNYSATPVNGGSGGNLPTVLNNDTLNGTQVDPADVTLTPGTAPAPAAGSITMNPDGTITVAPGTTAGTYTYPYTICEKTNPDNCDTATATIVVAPPVIDAVDDNYSSTPVNGANGGNLPTVLGNDTLNGAQVDPADVNLSPGAAPTPAAGSITMNPDGTITVAPGTTAGTYTYPYTICEKTNPDNCDTATATIVVVAPPINAVDDNYSSTPVNGADGGTLPTVLGNDTLNGPPVDPADVTLTPGPQATPPAASRSVDPVGSNTLERGTTSGRSTYPYTICEKTTPDNCDTATATIVVVAPPINAVDDNYSSTPVNGADGGNLPTVLGNDTLNGQPVDPADVTLTPGTLDTTPAQGGITMNPDGTITVAPGTTAGTYHYTYTICEKANPDNCDTATATIVVAPPLIDAVDDNYSGTPVNGGNGGNLPTVLANDTLNGAQVDPADVNLTPGTAPTPAAGSITMNPDGTITVAPGTTAGTYTYPYTICEKTNPDNCDTATATIVVEAPPIDAVDDNYSATPVNGADGGNLPTVLGNDTLNGQPVDPADVTLTPGTAPTPTAGSITMNPDGTITVAPGTTAGTYTYPYTICEKTNPDNCDTATATIVVAPPVIDAVDDNYSSTPVHGANGGNLPTGLGNDTLNGQPVAAAGVPLTPGTAPTPAAGRITMNPDGTITVAPGTTAGTYTYPYTICEKSNPDNCDTATATIVVAPPVIDAVDDNYSSTPVNGANGGNLPTVLGNDTLNGQPVAAADVTLTPGTAPAPAAGSITMNPDGTITVAPGTTAGTYHYTYTICEKPNPDNCDTATATIVVAAPPIDAVDDNYSSTPVNGAKGGNLPTVLGNDTLNGQPVAAADVTLTPGTAPTPAAGSITMNPDGTITVAPGTTAGTYHYTYTICEKANPDNCDTATATIVVAPPQIDAVDDDYSATPVSGANGGNLPTVLANDTLNGQPVAAADVNLTPGTAPAPAAGSITMNPDGTITVAPGTTAGTYTYSYTICEKLNPDNCDTATATIVVAPPAIDAVDDTYGSVSGTTGNPNVGNAYANDTLNGQVVDPADITGRVVTPATPINGGPVPELDPATGVVRVPPGTPAGTYTIVYEICEKTNPDNCDTATITVPVDAAPIDAVDDNYSATPVNGADGGSLPTVLGNDTLNGQPVVPAAVTLTPGTAPPPVTGSITLNPDGTITVAPGTTAGTYTYPYTICEKLNPDTCDTAPATIGGAPPAIDAVDDYYSATPVKGAHGGNLPTVLGNDTLNGQPVVPADVTLTPGTAPTPVTGSITMNPDGTITVAPGPTAGTYTSPYTICEKRNPDNCDTATATIVVAPPAIDAVDDDYSATPVTGADGGSLPTVLGNDTLTGQPVVPAAVTLTPGTAPTPVTGSITMNPDGTITVAPGTTAGTYTYPYTICEKLNPDNCDTATATIVVAPPAIDAVDDDYSATPVNGANGGNLPTVLGNDTLNGQPVVPADGALTPRTAPAPAAGRITMNPDGTITIAPGTTAGTYTYAY